MKKITVLTGSCHKNGTSFLLADEFIKGAREAGNIVTRFDAAFLNVRGCTGCNGCKTKGQCVYNDDFEEIIREVLNADVVAFVTPIYYYGMTAQLKAVIDRFHSVSDKLAKSLKQAVLISTCADSSVQAAAPLVMHYQQIIDYLQWENAGELTALGVPDKEALVRTAYPVYAKRLGERM